MKRIIWWGMGTVTTVVLLFGYRTSTEGPATSVAEPAISSTPTEGTASEGAASEGATTGGATAANATVTGDSVSTRWGDVQVAITVAGGRITDVEVPVYPSGNGRDQEINSYALPMLVQETISAQSSNIDMVSGATVTSVGYQQSLQSAIDQAGL
jgi:uncharacterized protein with FMN-binding domain